MARRRVPSRPSRYFNSSPEVIRLVLMMYVRYSLSLRSVEGVLEMALGRGLRPRQRSAALSLACRGSRERGARVLRH